MVEEEKDFFVLRGMRDGSKPSKQSRDLKPEPPGRLQGLWVGRVLALIAQ